MTIVTTYNINSLRSTWNRLYAQNPAHRPTQSYEYFRYLFLAFYSRVLKVGHWRMIFHYFQNGADECIVPLVVNRKRLQIRSVSCYGRLDYDDIISSSSSENFIADCIEEISNIYPHYELCWRNINEQGLLYPVLSHIAVHQEPCVAIPLPDTYGQYYASLSKHQRQNIRTSYNRLVSDGISISFHRFDKSLPMSHTLWNQCEKLYENRHKYNRGNCLRQWYDRFTNPYHHILMKHPMHELYVIMSNNKPIAYMAGLYDDSLNSYFVPRLCIDENFSRYSPGIILVNETVKLLIANGVRTMDLMSGDEPYKTAMGGDIHTNYQLNVSTDELLKYVHSS